MTFAARDGGEVDALVTDRYLEALLAARDRGAHDAPSAADLDPAIRISAGRLAAELTRVHPSFRFEERLATRLADAASRMSPARAAGAERVAATAAPELDPIDLLDPAHSELPPGHPRRPLIIGGTIASAAISIAGAAIVAWRLSRPAGDPGDPLARGVRSAHDRADRVRLA